MTEQEKATAGAPPKSPLVKVEKGNPTPEQLAVITAVIAQPCSRSTGPKSATGTTGPGLITGTACGLATRSAAGAAVTPAIVGCLA